MMTEADVQEQQRGPARTKSKRERRRDYARRVGEQPCSGCRHASMDHTPVRYTGEKFCHTCYEQCRPR